jgi:hypothetical protein
LFAGICLPVLVLLSAPLAPEHEKVEYIPTKLSATVTMVKGQGGNIAVSAGENGVFIIDDQLKPLTDQLLAAIRAIDERPVRFVVNTHYHSGQQALGGPARSCVIQGATVQPRHDHRCAALIQRPEADDRVPLSTTTACCQRSVFFLDSLHELGNIR